MKCPKCGSTRMAIHYYEKNRGWVPVLENGELDWSNMDVYDTDDLLEDLTCRDCNTRYDYSLVDDENFDKDRVDMESVVELPTPFPVINMEKIPTE